MITKADDELIKEVRQSLEEFSLSDIYRALSLPVLQEVDPKSVLPEGQAVIGAMTLCMCLFESLSGLYAGKDTNFAQFREKVLEEVNPRYRQPRIEFLRHGLVHGQTTVLRVGTITYQFELIQGKPEQHLLFDKSRTDLEHTIINVQSFINDTRAAFYKLFEKVMEHDKRVEEFKVRVSQVGWLVSPSSTLPQSTQTTPATGTKTDWLPKQISEQVLDVTIPPKEETGK